MRLDSDRQEHMQEYKKTYSYSGWVKLMQKIDDDKLQKICGTDAALYLIFLRYCSYFFASIAIINVIFIIIFLTGEPLPEDDFRKNPDTMYAMQSLTILNITGTPWKLILCFLNCMITITAMIVNLIFVFSKKYAKNDELDQSLHSHISPHKKLTELDVKKRTI